MKLIGETTIRWYLSAIRPFELGLARLNIHPNLVTGAGLAVTVLAANFFRIGYFLWGGLFVGLAGTCDVLDGRVARSTGKKSDFGAFFDSTIDRYSDVILFLGLMIFFNELYVNVLITLAITGSLLTSYARARAEGLGVDCKIGLMQRPERITYMAAAAFFDGLLGSRLDLIFDVEHFLIIFVLAFIALMSNITVLQRIIYLKRTLPDTKQNI